MAARVETTARGRTAVLAPPLAGPTLDSWLLLLTSEEEERRQGQGQCQGHSDIFSPAPLAADWGGGGASSCQAPPSTDEDESRPLAPLKLIASRGGADR